MKYFIKGSNDIQWNKNMMSYWKRFDKIKHKLPERLREIVSSKYLHDSIITAISLEKGDGMLGHSYNLILSLSNEIFEGSIIHYNVSCFSGLFYQETKKSWAFQYLYGELLYRRGKWTHSIWLSNDKELFIECERLEWRQS